MRIRIVQCLCSKRHALLALAASDASIPDAELLAALRENVEAILRGEQVLPPTLPLMHPWCGLCGERKESWTYEVRWSKEFADKAEALAAFKESERRNVESRYLLDALGLSYDAYRKRGLN